MIRLDFVYLKVIEKVVNVFVEIGGEFYFDFECVVEFGDKYCEFKEY